MHIDLHIHDDLLFPSMVHFWITHGEAFDGSWKDTPELRDVLALPEDAFAGGLGGGKGQRPGEVVSEVVKN